MKKLNTQKHWTENYYSGTKPIDRATDYTLYVDYIRINEELRVSYEILSGLGIEPKRILNLACGPNPAHSLSLAEKYQPDMILNLDYSTAFIELAKKAWVSASNFANETVTEFVHGDMRKLAIQDAEFDLVVLYGNSFGFFDHETNQQVLNQIRTVISPDGILLMTVPDYSAASGFTRQSPQQWCNTSCEGEYELIVKSIRYFDQLHHQSICETEIFEKSTGKLLSENTRCSNIYPTTAGNSGGQISFDEMGTIAGLKLEVDIEIQEFVHSFGLMRNLKALGFLPIDGR